MSLLLKICISLSLSLCLSSCCQQVQLFVGSPDQVRRDVLLEQLGVPRIRAVLTVEEIRMSGLLPDARLAGKVARLVSTSRAELVLWGGGQCFGDESYAVALLDPETGKVLLVDGAPLFANRTGPLD